MSQVTFEQTVKRYGDLTALEALDLEVREGEFLTLLGPSGCGKTTTLRLVAGFLEATSGRILIDREEVTRVPPQHRQIGMVFQDYALFPHMSVEQNIGFGLKERRVAPAEIRARVNELLDLVRLPGVENRYPSELLFAFRRPNVRRKVPLDAVLMPNGSKQKQIGQLACSQPRRAASLLRAP